MADPATVHLTSPDGTRTRGFTETTAKTMRRQGWTDTNGAAAVQFDGANESGADALADLTLPPPPDNAAPSSPTTLPSPGPEGTTTSNLESNDG